MHHLNDLLTKREPLARKPTLAGYRQIKSSLAKRAMATRVEAGECPGRAPAGYVNTVIANRRTVAVDPILGPLVAEAFQLAGKKEMSIRKILAELVPRGLVGQGGNPMGVSGLQVVLSNPFYAGLIRYAGAIYRGAHCPLISKSLFDRVHQRLFRRRCR